jgi:DNA-directed RNA polymerase omega subunit
MNNVIGENRFLKVLIAAQRAKQIHKGARPHVRSSTTRATRIALEEVERGLINFDFITRNPDLKSERDNRDVGGHVDVEVNREAANQLSVSRLLSVGRLSD